MMVSIDAIDPDESEKLQKVNSLKFTDMTIFSFVNNFGIFFYMLMIMEHVNGVLVYFDVFDMKNSTILEELDGEGLLVSIFYRPFCRID